MTVYGQFPGQGRFTRDDNGRHRFRPMQTTVTTVEGTVEAQTANVLQIDYFWTDVRRFYVNAQVGGVGASDITHALTPAEGKILSASVSPTVAATHDLNPAEGKIIATGVMPTAVVSHDTTGTVPADVGSTVTAEVTPASNFAASSIAAAAATASATASRDASTVAFGDLGVGPSATVSHAVVGLGFVDLGALAVGTISASTDFAASSIGAAAASASASATLTRSGVVITYPGVGGQSDVSRTVAATAAATTGGGLLSTITSAISGRLL